ncbi:MAG: ABC transporter ATP-binding protein [Sphingomonadaceae bacterium]|nr:ABC transporter ATP-binding protein [Sphingomonadaceae bacterium]
MVLTAERLAVDLGKRRVLDGVDFTAIPGELVAVIGPNGAGKSTLARALAGLLPASAGRVTLGGADLATLSPAAQAKARAYLPQGATLAWPLTVARLVALGRLPHLAPLGSIGDTDRAAIEAAMARADVLALRDRVVTQLSGGERARAFLARALAVEAGVLIADEPLAALDPGHALDVMALLRAEAERGVAAVAVLHELTLAARFADRLVLIDRGRVAAEGVPADVLADATLAASYGVTAWRGEACGAPLIVPFARVSRGRTPP